MSTAPNLLNDDGTASMATMLMMSHHAFRRDLACFAAALERLEGGDTARANAIQAEWQWFRGALHGHHESEDNGIFPTLSRDHESVRATIEKLSADHRRIDPLLERGDRAFAALSRPGEARRVIQELSELLSPHLVIEESELIPFLRSAKQFPAPPTDEMAKMYAQGFAWAMGGIAPDVVVRVNEMLPEVLHASIPAAREAFEARCALVWGKAHTGSSHTCVPRV